jgi:uncharacterized protein
MNADLAWATMQWPGLEHVIVRIADPGFRAEGQLVTAEDDPFRASYELDCDAAWRVRSLSVRVATAAGERALALSVTSDGHWTVDGQARPDLDGCVDLDINRTPLTNTLPIRRLSWSPGVPVDLSIAYVSIPELAVRAVQQRYTLLDRDHYRYESGTFRADLPVDQDGFVIDYPGLWQRVGAAA